MARALTTGALHVTPVARPLRVLHVNDTDLPGRRFNGYDLMEQLASRGIAGKQAVLRKLSHNPDVFSLWRLPIDEPLHRALVETERRQSINNILFPWGRVLAESPEFERADVVHFHLIHNHVISLLDVPMLARQKPTVWTLHDPWALTGRCVYPRRCIGWQQGCGICPTLEDRFRLDEDRSGRLWEIKRRLFAASTLDIVVASEFMRDMVEQSPLTRHIPWVHLIPFGIDAAAFLPDKERQRSRRLLGIPPDDFVLLFRASGSTYKGTGHIIDALDAQPPRRPTTLLTVDALGLARDLAHNYRVVDMGWVDDPIAIGRIYSAADVLLMPSTAEAFGLMALEAMAAGRPVICFEGTSLPSVTRAPECGLAVPMGDSVALRDAIDFLGANPVERERRGRLGREIAMAHHSPDAYLDALAALYAHVAARATGSRLVEQEVVKVRRADAPSSPTSA